MPCIVRKNTEFSRVDWERGTSLICPSPQGYQILFHPSRNSPCLVVPEFGTRVDSQWRNYLSVVWEVHQFSIVWLSPFACSKLFVILQFVLRNFIGKFLIRVISQRCLSFMLLTGFTESDFRILFFQTSSASMNCFFLGRIFSCSSPDEEHSRIYHPFFPKKHSPLHVGNWLRFITLLLFPGPLLNWTFARGSTTLEDVGCRLSFAAAHCKSKTPKAFALAPRS